MRVLIVEDYPGLVELYELGLRARGFEVVGAVTAGEALTRAATERFDAVVLDVQLPDGSGPALLRRMRQLPALEGRPIVGMSSYAPEDLTAHDFDAAAFDAFLRKPFHPKRLASVLRRLCDASRDLATAS